MFISIQIQITIKAKVKLKFKGHSLKYLIHATHSHHRNFHS